MASLRLGQRPLDLALAFYLIALKEEAPRTLNECACLADVDARLLKKLVYKTCPNIKPVKWQSLVSRFAQYNGLTRRDVAAIVTMKMAPAHCPATIAVAAIRRYCRQCTLECHVGRLCETAFISRNGLYRYELSNVAHPPFTQGRSKAEPNGG